MYISFTKVCGLLFMTNIYTVCILCQKVLMLTQNVPNSRSLFFLLNNCGRLVSISLDIDETESYINNHLVQDSSVYF